MVERAIWCRRVLSASLFSDMANPAQLTVLARARQLSIDMHRAFQHIHSPVNPELKSQLLRAASSISRNIAEGSGRSTAAQFSQFLGYAIGSANETEECLKQVNGVGLIARARYQAWLKEISEIRMMTYGLRRYVERKPDGPDGHAERERTPPEPPPQSDL